MPPLEAGQRFEDAYELLLVLDSREHANAAQGLFPLIAALGNLGTTAVRHPLPVGDALWVARRRQQRAPAVEGSDYVLDFVVERKSSTDLLGCISSGRYLRQKWRMRGCGLRYPFYLVETADDAGNRGKEEVGECRQQCAASHVALG